MQYENLNRRVKDSEKTEGSHRYIRESKHCFCLQYLAVYTYEVTKHWSGDGGRIVSRSEWEGRKYYLFSCQSLIAEDARKV